MRFHADNGCSNLNDLTGTSPVRTDGLLQRVCDSRVLRGGNKKGKEKPLFQVHVAQRTFSFCRIPLNLQMKTTFLHVRRHTDGTTDAPYWFNQLLNENIMSAPTLTCNFRNS